MTSIATLTSGENGANSLIDINANFVALNAGKTETGAVTTSGLTMSTGKILGRATAATGAVEEIAVTGSGSVVLATAPQISTVELGHASDTTLSRVSAGVIAVEGVTIPSISSTNTLTNKCITKRVLALSANSATPAINTDSYDVVHITAQTAAITSFTSSLTGTPVDGDTLRISVTGTAAVALTFGTSFEASGGVPLTTTTVTTARMDMGFFWNTETSKWRQIAQA